MNNTPPIDEYREPYIPVRVVDLIEILCTEAGTPDHPPPSSDDQAAFRTFARTLAGRMHIGFQLLLDDLKTQYARFDPDSDTARLRETTPGERVEFLGELFDTMNRLLIAAGYYRMSREEVEHTMIGVSAWGIEMDVCWDVFDRVEVFYRGKGTTLRTRRIWWKLFREEQVLVPTYRRVVIVMKLRRHPRLEPGMDVVDVYLQLFKDIPQMDIEMLLPGTRLRMPRIARGKLGGTGAAGFGTIFFKLTGMWGQLIGGSLFGWYALLTLLGTYAWKQYAGYQFSRRTYLLQLTQTLYYRNLDTNAGVLFRLFDDAEEQELRQTLLAYFFLWRFHGPEGTTISQLDRQIESDIEIRLHEKVEVDTSSAVDRLERYNIVHRVGDRVIATPIRQATQLLEYQQQSARRADKPSGWQAPAVRR